MSSIVFYIGSITSDQDRFVERAQELGYRVFDKEKFNLSVQAAIQDACPGIVLYVDDIELLAVMFKDIALGEGRDVRVFTHPEELLTELRGLSPEEVGGVYSDRHFNRSRPHPNYDGFTLLRRAQEILDVGVKETSA
ncbi:MAG: hypothetical protein ISS48_01125 [Candidatus Aenigmarchaeota archaeon]|nr:hypothetical protein [Candidatus Aenigmarchaeota archaeon]